MAINYENLNRVITIINGVFGSLITTSEMDVYVMHVNRASFTLNAPQILADLQRIEFISEPDFPGFLEKYLMNFKAAYKQSFMSSSGFGDVTSSVYADQATAAMCEIIDTYLAQAKQ